MTLNFRRAGAPTVIQEDTCAYAWVCQVDRLHSKAVSSGGWLRGVCAAVAIPSMFGLARPASPPIYSFTRKSRSIDPLAWFQRYLPDIQLMFRLTSCLNHLERRSCSLATGLDADVAGTVDAASAVFAAAAVGARLRRLCLVVVVFCTAATVAVALRHMEGLRPVVEFQEEVGVT